MRNGSPDEAEQTGTASAALLIDGDGERRDLRLDACRGIALLFIFLDHIPDNALAWLTLRNYGFSDTTEVFFFVSGYTCMLAYGGALRRHGWQTTIARALRRALEIYGAFLLLAIACFVLAYVIGERTFFDETNTAVFFADPGTTLARLVALRYMPVNTDVLPTFAVLHLVFPLVLLGLIRAPMPTLAASLVLYLTVRLLDWHVPAWPRGEWYFNPFAWQVLFVFGAWCGKQGPRWSRLRAWLPTRLAVALACLYLLFGLVVVLSWQFDDLKVLIPDALAAWIYPIDKSHLDPLRLVHFLALALLVVRFAPHDWRGLRTPVMTAIIRCGENSLAIYALGVMLSFLGHLVLVKISGGFAMQVAVSLAGIAVMIVIATLMTWEARFGRHEPKLF